VVKQIFKNISKVYFIVLLFVQIVIAQSVSVSVKDTPLADVILQLRDTYNIQFSYNDLILKDCIITINKTYANPDDAVMDLVSQFNLIIKKNGDVFIILPKNSSIKKESRKKKYYTFSGRISDSRDLEPLPLSNIQFGNYGITSDSKGNFTLKNPDSVVHIEATHIGYFNLDTNISYNKFNNLVLTPAVYNFKEVMVYSDARIYDMHIGERTGSIRINHSLAAMIPGNFNNALYNMLRLQPGIMAAGEQTGDYSIWGSYRGQTLILFDNFPLFSFSNFTERISGVNPLIIQDIEVLKGGYNSQFSNRVGGIVNIIGKNGNFNKFSGDINLNNQTISSTINIPVASRLALQASYRRTFDDLMDQKSISSKTNRNIKSFFSDNMFNDINLKLSGEVFRTDNFHISFLQSNDEMQSEYRSPVSVRDFSRENNKKKKQVGGALFYNRNWRSGISSNFTLSYSKLNSESMSELEYQINNRDKTSKQEYNKDIIDENTVKLENHFPGTGLSSISVAVDFTVNNLSYNDNNETKVQESGRLGGYIIDNITPIKNLQIRPGFRFDIPSTTTEIYLQPRLDASYTFFQNWKLNFGCGIYNQFVAENLIFDKEKNYQYIWTICDGKRNPVITGKHIVSGINFYNQDIKFSIEGYYKKISNMSQYTSMDKNKRRENLFLGRAKSYGVDFYFKKKIKRHEGWIAYSLSRSLEKFKYFDEEGYQPSPQDQIHEFKCFGLLNISPIFISANYIYGSGQEFIVYNYGKNKAIPYNRIDLAIFYRSRIQGINIELGLSLINVFNTVNTRFGDFFNIPDEELIYSRAMPFTTLVNLKIGF